MIGNLLGMHLIKDYITGSGASLFLFSRPGSQYIHTAGLLNSNSELKRLTGYYSLLDNRKIDVDFLIERYKRTIYYIVKITN